MAKTKRRPRCRVENCNISINVPVPMKDQMQALADDEGISLTAWIRRAAIRDLRRGSQAVAA